MHAKYATNAKNSANATTEKQAEKRAVIESAASLLRLLRFVALDGSYALMSADAVRRIILIVKVVLLRDRWHDAWQ